MKKSDILRLLKLKYPKIQTTELKTILNGTFEAMIEALQTKGRVEIRGLGTFKVKYKKPKVARNPKTGKKIYVDGRKTVQYKMSKVLKRKLFNA
ncbi:MAG: integration host factor subunit beta [Hydrogenothermus sp.]|nr:MAG: integration host factor subunit beta [Hydrogenothermus sp.]